MSDPEFDEECEHGEYTDECGHCEAAKLRARVEELERTTRFEVAAAYLKVAESVHRACIAAAYTKDSEAAVAVECDVSLDDAIAEALK